MGFRETFDDNRTGDSWFKPKDGDNKIRVLAEPVIVVSNWKEGICYTDCGYCGKEAKEAGLLSTKYLTWIIDRKDGIAKLYKMPYKVTKVVRGLMDSEEYSFEGFPMPYDININATNAGTKEVEYVVTAARKNTDITKAELDDFESKTDAGTIVERMKAKQKEKKEGKTEKLDSKSSEEVDYPNPEDEGINPDEIPF